MKMGSRREFIFSSLLMTGVIGSCTNIFQDKDNISFTYEPDYKKIIELEKRKEGIIISSTRGKIERNYMTLEIKILNEEKNYTISVKTNKNGGNDLSLNLLQNNCIGDIINFPTYKVEFNSSDGNYTSEPYFPDESTYALIDIDKIRIKYNSERDKYRESVKSK